MTVLKVTQEENLVTISFERGEEPWLFRDAIVLTPEEYAKLTPEDIDVMEQKRYEDWLAIVNLPEDEIILE
jgi:hypothetical protein